MNGHLNENTLKQLKRILVKMHKELANDMRLEEEHLHHMLDPNFKESLNMKEEMEIVEVEGGRSEVAINEVEEALQRISDGTYGTCPDCGVYIPVERLRLIPFARYCARCESKREARGHK